MISPLVALMKDQVRRKRYSRLNQLRSITNGISFMTLTATATTQTKTKIFNLLDMEMPFEVVTSPNRNNICYVVQKMENGCSLVDNFQCILSKLKTKGKHSMRTIIYCQTILQCSLLYNLFTKVLGSDMYLSNHEKPDERLIEMMHSQTVSNVKDHILLQFSQANGHLRVLIATIAFGMGINSLGVRRVIHFGPSKTIEAYVQESGRCGRGGQKSYAILLYNSITLRAADESMKAYINNKSVCRRETMLKHFDSDVLPVPSGHLCCDICAETCSCSGVNCDVDIFLPVGQHDIMDVEINTRHVTGEQKQQLNIELCNLQKKIVISHVTYPTTLMQSGKYQIEQVMEQNFYN